MRLAQSVSSQRMSWSWTQHDLGLKLIGICKTNKIITLLLKSLRYGGQGSVGSAVVL